MSNFNTHPIASLAAALLCAAAAHAGINPITNAGFEAGLSGWTSLNQVGSDGAFFSQAGMSSPLNTFAVPAPPEGLAAAMTDSTAGGSHVLYQDFVVPSDVTAASIEFSLYINNAATAFFTPAHLDWTTPALNQQARVDIITTSADPFSVAALDILQSIFLTPVGSPPVSGYNLVTANLTALLAARPGQTLRLRFAEVDNVNFFNFGVDAVNLNIIPAPSAPLVAMVLIPRLFLRSRRRR